MFILFFFCPRHYLTWIESASIAGEVACCLDDVSLPLLYEACEDNTFRRTAVDSVSVSVLRSSVGIAAIT